MENLLDSVVLSSTSLQIFGDHVVQCFVQCVAPIFSSYFFVFFPHLVVGEIVFWLVSCSTIYALC